jgi:ribosome-associated protein
MNSRELALAAVEILDGRKAADVTVVDISSKSSFADYFVVASGGSERQLGSLAREVETQLAEQGVKIKNLEGRPDSGWILMDYGDVIVNVFSVVQRERYQLEKIWSGADFTEPEEPAE